MTASKRVSRRSSESDLARVDAHVIRPHEYEELPELSDDMLARGTVNKGGRPRSAHPRKLISLRLPEEVSQGWRASAYPGELSTTLVTYAESVRQRLRRT